MARAWRAWSPASLGAGLCAQGRGRQRLREMRIRGCGPQEAGKRVSGLRMINIGRERGGRQCGQT